MIVSALVRRYEDTLEVPPGWQKREISYALDIDESGRLLGIITLEVPDGKKTKKRALVLPIEPPGRTSGVKAAFLCDNGSYFLGLDPKRGAEKFAAAKAEHENVLSHLETPAAKAVLAYFEAGIPLNAAEFINLDAAAKALFVFQVNGKFVDFSEAAVKDSWNEYYAKKGGDTALCLVTGKQDSLENVHGTIKLFGGQTSGSSLISANCESFTSYGKTVKDRAADVGKYAAFAYVTALNALLKDEKRHCLFGKDTLVYWAAKGGEAEEELFADMFSPPKKDEDMALSSIMERIAKGERVSEIDMEREFYILCLSPNAARISVRFFLQSTFGDIVHKIQAHYSRLQITEDGRTPYRFLPPWMILSETTVKKSTKDAAPLLGGLLSRAILTDSPYPVSLYQAIMTRIRAGEPVNQTKAAVIKAVLIKNYDKKEIPTVALNLESTNKPYVLGRLFATLEQLQRAAADVKLNRTIFDSYFTSACANPQSVFPTILKLSTHHMSKTRKTKPGYAVHLDKRMQEIMEILEIAENENPFPSTLEYEDQGRFIVGYYHQMAFKKSEEDTSDEQ